MKRLSRFASAATLALIMLVPANAQGVGDAVRRHEPEQLQRRRDG